MKKLLKVLIMSLIIIMFNACSGGGGGQTPNPETNTTNPDSNTTNPVQKENRIPAVAVNGGNIAVDGKKSFSVFANQNLELIATAIDSDGSIVGVQWKTENGSVIGTELSLNFSGATNSVGVHSLTFSATDDDGETSSTPITVEVKEVVVVVPENQVPTINTVTVTGILRVDQPVTVTVNATDTDGDIVSYRFSGDITGDSSTATNSFSTSGVKTVTIVVTDDDGATATASKSFTIMANQAPTGTINIIGTLKTGHNVTVNVSASDSDGAVVSTVLSGDFTQNGQTKTFLPGVYSVEAVITDNEGAQTVVTQTFTIVDLSNQEKVDNFNDGRPLEEIISGAPIRFGDPKVTDGLSADMLGGDFQAYWDNNEKKMVTGQVPCGYYYEAGKRGMLKKPDSNANTPAVLWDAYVADYSDEDGFDHKVKYISLCSIQGIYDILLWNEIIEPNDWKQYNSMAQFKIHTQNNTDYVAWSEAYTENWSGKADRIDNYAPSGVVYTKAENGYKNYVDVNNTALDEYVVEANDVREGLTEGMILYNCVHAKNAVKGNEGPNNEKGNMTDSIICGPGYGIIKMDTYLIDDEYIGN